VGVVFSQKKKKAQNYCDFTSKKILLCFFPYQWEYYSQGSNIVADMLAIIVEHAKAHGKIKEGNSSHCGWCTIYYSIGSDLEKARHLKLNLKILSNYEILKLIFIKVRCFCFGEAQDEADLYTELFSYRLGQFSIRYLDIQIHYRRLTNAE
jgi:hypothetical protein